MFAKKTRIYGIAMQGPLSGPFSRDSGIRQALRLFEPSTQPAQ
jgi:hypothetical protein